MFAIKILCEKEITPCYYSTHILQLDITKVFQAINKEHLHKLFSELVDRNNSNIMNILLKDVTQQVENNRAKGHSLTTLGFPQSHCLIAILLKSHLSSALSAKIPTHVHDHYYNNAHSMFPTNVEHLHDHNYCTKQVKNNITEFLIDQQYTL